MSYFLNIPILFFVIYLIPNFSLADTGPASKYEITMTKIELCTGYPDGGNNDVTCTGGVTVGEGSLNIDIASVSAGKEIATFSDTNGLPIGTTFTHTKITLKKELTIRGYAQDDTDCWCRTESDSTYNSGNGKYGSHIAGVCEENKANAIANEEDSTMYVAFRGTTIECQDSACTSNSRTTTTHASIETDGVNQDLYGMAMEPGTSNDTTLMSIIYKLSSPYTVGIIAPKIVIAFGVASAINSNEWDEANDKCLIYPFYPRVDIAITE